MRLIALLMESCDASSASSSIAMDSSSWKNMLADDSKEIPPDERRDVSSLGSNKSWKNSPGPRES